MVTNLSKCFTKSEYSRLGGREPGPSKEDLTAMVREHLVALSTWKRVFDAGGSIISLTSRGLCLFSSNFLSGLLASRWFRCIPKVRYAQHRATFQEDND